MDNHDLPVALLHGLAIYFILQKTAFSEFELVFNEWGAQPHALHIFQKRLSFRRLSHKRWHGTTNCW
jgi:hypothetical protein